MENTTIQTDNIILNKSRIIDIIEIDAKFKNEVISTSMNTTESGNEIEVKVSFRIIVFIENWNVLECPFKINRAKILNYLEVPEGYSKNIDFLDIQYKEKNINNPIVRDYDHYALKEKQGFIINGSALLKVVKSN